jgi:hypothetical protein
MPNNKKKKNLDASQRCALKKAQRAAATRRYRERLRCGQVILPFQVGERTFDLMTQFDLLSPDKFHDRKTVCAALAKLFTLGINALLRERITGVMHHTDQRKSR